MGGADKSLQELLKVSIKYSEQESKPLKPTVIDEERKDFLQGAINQALQDDDYKKLVIWTKKFLEYKADDVLSEDQLSEVSEVFEGLNFLLEGMDVSIDFNKLGGLKHCLVLLRCNYSSIQWRAADMMANCTQNIPQNQYSVIEERGFKTLLFVLKQTEVDVVKVKCLYALSSLLGGNTVAEKLFIDLKGGDVITKLLGYDNVKVRLKAGLLLRKVVYSETVRFAKNKSEITAQLIESLRTDHNDSHEVLAEVLLTLINTDELSLNECRKNKTVLSGHLSQRIEELQATDVEKYQDVIEIYTKLLKFL